MRLFSCQHSVKLGLTVCGRVCGPVHARAGHRARRPPLDRPAAAGYRPRHQGPALPPRPRPRPRSPAGSPATHATGLTRQTSAPCVSEAPASLSYEGSGTHTAKAMSRPRRQWNTQGKGSVALLGADFEAGLGAAPDRTHLRVFISRESAGQTFWPQAVYICLDPLRTCKGGGAVHGRCMENA